ncbi:thyrotropin-releasing hormone receptor [Prorops nasuta]|uniref:thyrotropin-releasing hormone receptor n=1 Tax=Prorops nasuta TaxID=863751 RepID=UPI0034CFB301
MTFDTNSTTVEEPNHSLTHYLQLYYTPILVYLGCLGNILSVCVFFCTKLRRYSSSIYLGALAISDTGFLVALFITWLSMVNVRLFNEEGYCQVITYLTTLCSFLSVWFVVAFTVERFIAVRYPLRRQSMCTVARAKTTVGGLVATGMFVTCPVLWYSGVMIDPEHNITICGLRNGWESYAIAYNYVDTVLTFVLPLTLITILNALIVKTVYKLAGVRRTMTSESRSTQDSHACSNQSPRGGSSQTKITKMLLIVSSVFLCFNLPAYVIRLLVFLKIEVPEMEVTQKICYLLFNTNFGINFALYCASGQNFRRAMAGMFYRRSTKRSAVIVQMSDHNGHIGRSSTRQRAIVITESWKDLHEMQALCK